MDIVEEVLKKTRESNKFQSISVNKHLEVECDVGNLLAFDTNDLDKKSLARDKNEYLLKLTRENVQLLLNKVWDLPTEKIEEAIVVRLPPSTFPLPRSKPVPKPKSLTKWQQFAKDKGITKNKKSKLSWDDQLKKWVPLYGYKRAAAEREKSWVLEVPDNADPMEDQFTKRSTAKNERIAKNELQRLRNIAKARNIKIPRVGFSNTAVATSKDLQQAVTVARSSTASLGKFQDKLPKEKEARGVTAITPGASRKRKLPVVPSSQEKQENMAIIESVLNKKPKLIDKSVAISNEEQTGSKKSSSKPKPKRGRPNSSKASARPKASKASGKGQHKGKPAGRKRR